MSGLNGRLLVYTSILHAETATNVLAKEHKLTEAYIRAAGIPCVILRNGWYLENHTEALGPAVQHGAILGAAGEGRFASAARADYARAAVAVLTTDRHAEQTYELAGDAAYTPGALAAEVSSQAGKPVAYHDLPQEEYAQALAGFGLPAELADVLASADAGAGRGELDVYARDRSCFSSMM